MEFEATVPGITAKVQSALNSEEPLILTDAQGNEIVESEGTKGISLRYFVHYSGNKLLVKYFPFQRRNFQDFNKRANERGL
ncbi:hypothetical protein QTP70_024299, partial [Hemibagrus guttatus]